jgi:predicted DNA-binding transcriptional regulator AlpA
MSDITETSLLPARRVQQRYDISDRTLDRWLANPKLDFPKPITINARRYFRIDELATWERDRSKAGAR